MKKAVLVLLAFLIAVPAAAVSLAGPAAAGLDNFTERTVYTEETFSDVSPSDWFSGSVAAVYELGLMNGKKAGRFDPSGNITVAEACTVAARLHSIYTDGTEICGKTSPWYAAYVDYCAGKGIISGPCELPEDLNSPASRRLFAAILGNALPEEALAEINYVPDGSVPDVGTADAYGSRIYALYRAGILTGSDSHGTFSPDDPVRRSEAAAVITRMADPSLRRHVFLHGLTDEDVDALLGMPEEIRYSEALNALGSGRLREAKKLFGSMPGYRDSGEYYDLIKASPRKTVFTSEDGEVTETDDIYETDGTGHLLRQVVMTRDGSGYSLDFTYDDAGRPLTMLYIYRGTTVQYTEYTYNTKGDLARETDTYPDGTTVTNEYIYNGNGQLVEWKIVTERQGSGTTDPSEETVVYRNTYDSSGRIIAEARNGAETIRLAYDEHGRLIRRNLTSYVYDENGRLIRREFNNPEEYGGFRFAELTYDSDGNLLSDKIDGNGYEYTYDGNGNMLTRTMTDSSGEQLYTNEYEYDGSGRRIKATETHQDGTVYINETSYDEDGNFLTFTCIDCGRVSSYEYSDYVWYLDPNEMIMRIKPALASDIGPG
jgi:YD repeat-containing protein